VTLPWFPVLLAAHSIRFQQLSLLIFIFATIISTSPDELFLALGAGVKIAAVHQNQKLRLQLENAGTYDARRFRDAKEMTFRPAMESQARNGNASQEQRTSSDNPKKL
jgi:hypothetical protein